MYGRYEFQDQGCRCDNKSGGQRPVNPSWEYDRLDDPARFGIGRFEKDREGILVDGKKSVCTSALGCHDTANAFQMDRQTYRSKSEDNAPVSNFLWTEYIKEMALPGSYEDRGIPEPFIVENDKDIADYIVKLSVDLGFGDPTILDVDSTVQESNMSYPSDATFDEEVIVEMQKTAGFFTRETASGSRVSSNQHDMDCEEIPRVHFFGKEYSKGQEARSFQGTSYFRAEGTEGFRAICRMPSPRFYRKSSLELSGYSEADIRRCTEISLGCRTFCDDVLYEEEQDTFLKAEGRCLCKEREAWEREGVWESLSVGQDRGEFPRTLFLYVSENGRQGNPSPSYPRTSISIQSKRSFVGSDRQGLLLGLQCRVCKRDDRKCGWYTAPCECKGSGRSPRTKELFNRRAGVEPLIGHAKRFGLGKSMMKSDEATLASGYRSVTGFNLHQLMRNLEGTSRLSTA